MTIMYDSKSRFDEMDQGYMEGNRQSNVDGKRVFTGVEKLKGNAMSLLFDIEISYCRGDLDDAMAKVDLLMDSDIEQVVLAAQTYRMVLNIARNRVDRAYDDFCELKEIIDAGLANPPDGVSYGPYVLSAMIIESTLAASVFDLSGMGDAIDSFSNGMITYFGYLIVMRYLRHGDYRKAAGIAYAYQTLVGPNLPESKVFLLLTSSIANLMMGDVDLAEAEFDAAWTEGRRHGIIMPFVTLHYFLIGMPRHYCNARGIDEPRKISSMARTFRKGWFGIRRKCGLPAATSSLTTLESYVAGLASLGWSNRQIAAWLSISENTVKHHLTSSYQKLNVSNRKGLAAFLVKEFRSSSMEADSE